MVDPEEKYISRVFTREDVSKYEYRKKRKRPRSAGYAHQRWLEESILVKDIRGFFIGPASKRRRPERVVVVDDNILFFLNHLCNVVPIRRFQGDAADDELTELTDFLMSLTRVEDVREEERKRFDLLAYVGSHGWSDCSSSEEQEEGGGSEHEEFAEEAPPQSKTRVRKRHASF